MKIWVARHGETAPNKAGLFLGHGNPRLLPEGKKTAKKVGRLLKKKIKGPFAIYSSPLARARQTAKIIAKELGHKKIVFEKNLRERGFGKWEGKTRKEVERLFPGSIKRWVANPYKEIPAWGESFFSQEKRVSAFLKKIGKQKQKEIIIVAHGGVIRVLPRLLLGTSRKQSLKINTAHNTVHLFDLEKKKMKSFKAR